MYIKLNFIISNILLMMDCLSDDILQRVLFFLSLNEKKFVREVSSNFKTLLRPFFLLEYKMDNLLNIIRPTEMKMPSDLTCYKAYNNCTIYKRQEPNRIHSLFARNNMYDKCVVDICREKRMGYIYYCKKQTPTYHQSRYWNFYNRRNIPYCSKCFNYWSM
jgi:hypothetical protein